MKNIKIIILIFIIFINTIFISGCWNYREIDEVSIVTGAAIDKTNDKYRVTVETIAPKGGEELKMESDILSMEGNTIFDAIRNIIFRSGKKLYWSHAKAIIISKDVAKEGVLPVIDFFTRDAETRGDIWLLVSRDKTAKELLEGKSKIYDTTAFHIDGMLKAEDALSKYHAVELWYFLDELSGEGISAAIPTTKMIDKGEERIPEIYGMAVFKKDKMVGFLNGIETRSMLIIKDELKGGLVIALNVADSDTDVALELFDGKTKVKPVFTDGEISMKIDIKMDVGIAELAGEEDFISKEGREKLKKRTGKLIKKQIEDTIKKVQKEYKSDIFGFGSIIQRENPDKWKEIKGDWEDIFSDLDTAVNVEVNIKGSALTSKPIKVGD